MTIAAVVLGAGGYVGGELLRLLGAHPRFSLAAAISETFAGKPVADVFPHLGPACPDAVFRKADAWADGLAQGSEVALFSAAPHGASAAAIAAALTLAEGSGLSLHVVDASADFRYDEAAAFSAVYGIEHPAPALIPSFVCAVPEHLDHWDTPHAAHPGCFATASLLAAVPLVRAGIVADDLYVSGVTGSTGSGRTPKAGTHHPERNSNLYAYNPLAHRHSPEVERLIRQAAGCDTNVHFVPHSGPFARGIHVTLQARTTGKVSAADIAEIFRDAYRDSAFVSLTAAPPKIKDVVASNMSHIGVAADDRSVSVMCVIDNLVKGAAGGAMQWMNRLWGLPEETGLTAPAPGWT